MTLSVLIVEDSEPDTKMVLHELRRGGYTLDYMRVDNAEDMKVALNERHWDVVISDYTMPNFDGLSALTVLKESGLDLPFIIVYGSIGEALAVHAMKSGAHDYLMKDSLARLVPAVEREIREAQIRYQREKAERALHQAYADLEMRVEERTAELAQSNALLQEALKIRDEFLSIAAHELKTPITSLSGFAELLIRRFDKTGTLDVAEVRQSLRVIKQQANKMTQLIAQLMDTSRINSDRLILQRTPTDIIQLINDSIAAARLHTPDFEIESIAHDPIIIFIDPLRIEQVFSNLISNAIKYSPDQHPVNVAIVATQEETPGTLCIAVTDHGIGIPAEHRAHIFERYYQAHGNGYLGGMGLGLYISQQIVKLHGGHIALEIPPEGGTRFVVCLPLNE